METLEAIAKRTSTRKFKKTQISEENLQAILEAGMSAPVGSGLYDSLHITIIQNTDILNAIGDAVTEMVSKKFGKRMDKNFGAPTMIVVSSKPAIFPGIEYANAACVIENMAIAATSLGIDNVVWAGPTVVISKETAIRSAVNIPDGFNPVLCISFGYGAEENTPKRHEIPSNRT